MFFLQNYACVCVCPKYVFILLLFVFGCKMFLCFRVFSVPICFCSLARRSGNGNFRNVKIRWVFMLKIERKEVLSMVIKCNATTFRIIFLLAVFILSFISVSFLMYICSVLKCMFSFPLYVYITHISSTTREQNVSYFLHLCAAFFNSNKMLNVCFTEE